MAKKTPSTSAAARTGPAITVEYGGLNYNAMDAEQLEAENNRLSAARDSIREEQKRLTAVLDTKMIAVRMSKKLDSLSGPERAALAQLVSGAGGIESEEAFGAPGS